MHRILKYFFILASCLLLPASAFAQSTLVNGTVTDPNGIPYSGATLKAVLVVTGGGVAPGSPTVTVSSQAQCTAAGAGTAPCQIPIQGTFTTTLDASGKIPGGGITLYDNSLVTPAGTQWFFTITITGIAPPLGNGPQTFSVLITISGAAQNIGATLTAAAPKLTNFGGGSSLISGSVTPTHLTFASGVDTIGDVLGSAVTAGTGAATLTASGDAVTPFSVVGHSATQSSPIAKLDADGSGHCIAGVAVCISSNGLLGFLIGGTGGDATQIRMLDTDSVGPLGLSLSYSLNQALIVGEGSDSLNAYITLGDDFAPQQSNVSIYSELWTYFGFNGNTSWKDAINSQTGQIRAGWLPDKVGQVAQGGFLSVVDGALAHEVNIKNPGTMAANFNFNIPITAGTAGQPLISEAGGTTPMQWGAISGSGSFCLTTSCVMTTPNLGTPSAGTLTNATGLPFSGIASGTNATAAMVVGTGASLGTSGTGTINATTLGGATFPVPIGSTTCGTCPILNPTINVDQGMIQLSLGAGYLNLATRPFSIEAAGNYTTTAASAPALNFEVQLCTISLCGSGTVVDLIDITTTTLSATALSNATWTISATCVINATGATGNLVCKGSPGLTLDTGASIVTPDSTFADTNSVVSGNIDLTAALFLRFTVAQSVAGASNSYTQTLASIR